LVRTSRNVLGSQRYITSAPQAPYACVKNTPNSWPGPTGGYYKVYQDSADNWDWFNIQFYNQGQNYNTYRKIFIESGQDFPASSINQLYNDGKGIPYEKMVYGTYIFDGEGSIHRPGEVHKLFTTAVADPDLNWTPSISVWSFEGLRDSTIYQRVIYSGSLSGGSNPVGLGDESLLRSYLEFRRRRKSVFKRKSLKADSTDSL